MLIKATVVCSKKWSKDGKNYNTITLSVIGIGAMDFTVDERLVPDLLDGSGISLELGIGASKGKPFIRPKWETLKVLSEDVE